MFTTAHRRKMSPKRNATNTRNGEMNDFFGTQRSKIQNSQTSQHTNNDYHKKIKRVRPNDFTRKFESPKGSLWKAKPKSPFQKNDVTQHITLNTS